MTKSLTPFLMFTQGGCEAAITFYASLFSDSRIDSIVHYPEDGSENSGRVMMATFTLKGRPYRANDSVGFHKFDFSPSFSIFVECKDLEEIEHLFEILSDGGMALMPLDNYGFSQRFGWVQDRFKVSWQLILA